LENFNPDLLRCPSCGNKPLSVKTRYGIRSSCCDLWSWGCKPLVDKKTHEARKLAHSSFDRLWMVEGYTRGRAYQMLEEEFGIGHIAEMDTETALKVPMFVLRVLTQEEIPLD